MSILLTWHNSDVITPFVENVDNPPTVLLFLMVSSPGCCHVDCLKKAAIDGMKFQSGRRLDSIHSTISLLSVSVLEKKRGGAYPEKFLQNSGPWEVLNVDICIIKKWGNHVYRTLLEYEFPSQTRVAELWNVLDEYRHCLSSSFGRSYYSWKKPQSYEDVQLISLIDTNLRFYNLMGYKPLFGGKLFILCVVSDGILVE
uniref:ALOG domain-containing protein n=1 Tax=Caenorhabditis tropicalis TaxID=1561998 RepID=A0A1I7TPM4_9PELO